MNSKFQSFLIWSFLIALLAMNSCAKKPQTKPIISSEYKSITETLTESNHLPISERISLYHKFKTAHPTKNNIEDDVNMYGYSLLWDDKLNEAIEIFKLLTVDYPNSSNAFDSLAEVYQKAGEKDKALINYEKSLALDSDNFNAEDQIELIKNPDKKTLDAKDKFDKKYTIQEYRDDLDQLGETLLRVHPNALKFITKVEFEKLIENKKSLVNENMTYAEFTWHCSEVVANINCSHTSTEGFYQKNQMLPLDLRFPLQTRLVDNRLYVIDPLNNKDLVSVKDEIESINGVATSILLQKLYKHLPSQGYIETSKRHEFNTWSTIIISFALNFPQEYVVNIVGNKESITLLKAEYHNDPKRDESMVYCGDNLCLEYIDKGKKIANMTISSFNYYERNNFNEFKQFIDESMNELNTNGTEQLIIDLRNNRGGSPESSIHLLKYLIHEPFTYYSEADFENKTEKLDGEKLQLPFENGFEGKLSFIIDGRGNSTTGHFMSLVKVRNLGVIIGEELGSNQFCSAGQKRCRLSNTKMQFFIANNTHISTANSLPDEVGILPDYSVTQSIEDYINAKDTVKQYTIDLITKHMDWEPASTYHSSYFLETNSTWRKELFRIPLNFAPDISLRGIEDARFPIGWEVKDSSTFWSYVFAWNVDHPQAVSTDELSANLELYFDGLMRMERRTEEDGITKTTSNLKRIETSNEIISYTGEITTFDAFFDKKPITFNVKADQYYCEEINRAITIFRFSPQYFDSDAWDILAEVTLPDNICDD